VQRSGDGKLQRNGPVSNQQQGGLGGIQQSWTLTVSIAPTRLVIYLARMKVKVTDAGFAIGVCGHLSHLADSRFRPDAWDCDSCFQCESIATKGAAQLRKDRGWK
jgi:hypothetical protein